MTQLHEIDRLKAIAKLTLDHRLTCLRQAADAKTKTEKALADIAEPLPDVPDLNGANAGLVFLNYQRWVDRRKSELNQTLALQTYNWLVSRDSASVAFGKMEAISKISNGIKKIKIGGKRIIE